MDNVECGTIDREQRDALHGTKDKLVGLKVKEETTMGPHHEYLKDYVSWIHQGHINKNS